jgi:uncharacterized protein
MQEVKLPHAIDPVRAAQQRLSYHGVLVSDQLPRLHDAASLVEPARVELDCIVDAQKLPVIQGRIQARVMVECQRCSGPFEQALDVTFAYCAVAQGDDNALIPEAYEQVELDDQGELNLNQLLEDELLLALPLVPRHELADCGLDLRTMSFGELPAEALKRNPFEALSQLKKD